MSDLISAIYWIPLGEFIVAFFKATAWPGAVILVAFWFSKEVRTLIPRISKVSLAGVEISHPVQQTNDPKELDKEILQKGNADKLTDPVARQIEEANLEDLNNLDPEDSRKREKVLLRSLTQQQMQKLFAIAYANIFGSQIRALHELNSRSISVEEAEEMFTELKREQPALENWTLKRYLDYLFVWRFIDKKGDAISITETGKNFLHFLVLNSLSESRLN
ncbi:hypothetical protein [Roseovarius sp. Pro17]|uniref:hypothetical protein n=1 Tax=Roseovarius sp. Pro17 TaxID=3108175 RepID=UPI002D774D3E|nr:hypothetical protein [Roseovarius sp. Pro17]